MEARTTLDGYTEKEQGLVTLEALRSASVFDLVATLKAVTIEVALRGDMTTTEFLEQNVAASRVYAPAEAGEAVPA